MTVDRPEILIADDQQDVLEALKLLLKSEGFGVETAASPAGILAVLEDQEFDVILMDLNYARDTTSGKEGLDLLQQIQAMDPRLPVVVMTAWGSIEGAVEAMRRGARDYIEKPWDNERLLHILRTHVELARAVRRTERLENENRLLRKKDEEELPQLIAQARSMQPVLRLMERVGPSDANVLILGEHGTGKEVVARWLHGVSHRKNKSLVPVNAGGISEGVFESEFFGHVKGAFTDAKTDRVGYFEMADEGTLFLDEIANVPLAQQAKLLRVLETGEIQRVGSSRSKRVNVRLISATNADLDDEVGDGRFREDLLYRLNTVEIQLPPLRERREDIPLLANLFLKRESEHYGKKMQGFHADAMKELLDYSWPGNVRELEHTVERAVLLSEDELIAPDDLRIQTRSRDGAVLEDLTLEEAERILIKKALSRHDGNVSRAADALGLSRSALYRRLQRYGLQA